MGETENILSAGMVNVVKKADRKLTFIPIVFVLLRMWGTIQFFYSLGVSSYIKCACTNPIVATAFQVLNYLQVNKLLTHNINTTFGNLKIFKSYQTLQIIMKFCSIFTSQNHAYSYLAKSENCKKNGIVS